MPGLPKPGPEPSGTLPASRLCLETQDPGISEDRNPCPGRGEGKTRKLFQKLRLRGGPLSSPLEGRRLWAGQGWHMLLAAAAVDEVSFSSIPHSDSGYLIAQTSRGLPFSRLLSPCSLPLVRDTHLPTAPLSVPTPPRGAPRKGRDLY